MMRRDVVREGDKVTIKFESDYRRRRGGMIHTGVRRLAVTETIRPDDSQEIVNAKSVAHRGGIDIEAVRQACVELGIERPVAIKRANGTGTRGCYRPAIDPKHGQMHSITLSTYSSAYGASRTLWHELVHCAQVEKLGLASLIQGAAKLSETSKTVGYAHSPYEAEAIRVAAANANRLLTKPGVKMTGGLVPRTGGVR